MSDASTKTRLRLLDDLQIASPCKASWDHMRGDERVRFCAECEKNVYNLSSMARAEAEALVRENEGRLCVRFYRRDDGTVLTADCPVGVRRKLYRRLASAAAGLGLLFAGLRTFALARVGRPVATLGAVAVATPPPPAIMGAPPAPRVDSAPPEPPLLGKPHRPAPKKPRKIARPKIMMGEARVGGIGVIPHVVQGKDE